ncbi:MAG: type II/IV secretion system protein [Candidatus Hydrogenedentes bacterium]|nr:type II/IV secretion system protein [Candidatus Hydrogenedentota bacterium]
MAVVNKRKEVAEVETAGGGDSRPMPFSELEQHFIELLNSGSTGAIQMVDAVLAQALAYRASDVHLEPRERKAILRYRIDGLLHPVAQLPAEHHPKVVGRIKVLSRIVTYQKDLPQDGRIDGESVPFAKPMRVSTYPTVYGEKIVIRVLDKDPTLFSLDALGFRPEIVAGLRRVIARPQGVFLLTGPASSGKTTSIYALLDELHRVRGSTVNIVTIEDPVEYRLDFATQTEINPHLGFTFDAALRAVLRQDPEVIMLGEVRDTDTARAVIQAGLTGHFVISTIHAGTAAGVSTRLIEMGIEPYMITSCLTGVLAQRLLRKNCPDCTAPYDPPETLRKQYDPNPDSSAFKHGVGCASCYGIGYRSRRAVGELLPLSEKVAQAVLGRKRTGDIHQVAISEGMIPLQQDAFSVAQIGETTLEEVQRVLPIEKN